MLFIMKKVTKEEKGKHVQFIYFEKNLIDRDTPNDPQYHDNLQIKLRNIIAINC